MSRSEPGYLYNLNFEIAPAFTAVQTADNWIDGTAAGSASNDAFGWWASPRATAIAVQFDSSQSHSGANSLKLSNTDVTGRVRVTNVIQSGGSVLSTAVNAAYFIPVVSGGTYTWSGWCKTNNCAAGSATIGFNEHNSAFAIGVSNGATGLTGTNGWTLLSVTATVAATTKYVSLGISNDVAGNISDAWFDDLTFTGPTAHTSGIFNNHGLRPHPFSPGLAR